MKFICVDKKMLYEEELYRIKFLKEVFGLFFIKKSNPNIIEYISYPYVEDIVIIYGHNLSVNRFLDENYLNENTVIIISCDINLTSIKKLTNKIVYRSIQSGGVSNTYDKELYGFGFSPTDSEILLYNNRNQELKDLIDISFERVM